MSTLDTTNITISKVLIAIAGFIIAGMIGFHIAEGWHWFDSLYFTITTIATISLGDIIPVSTAGKVLTMIYAVMGVPLFITVSGYILREILAGHWTPNIHAFWKKEHYVSEDPTITKIIETTEIIKE